MLTLPCSGQVLRVRDGERERAVGRGHPERAGPEARAWGEEGEA